VKVEAFQGGLRFWLLFGLELEPLVGCDFGIADIAQL